MAKKAKSKKTATPKKKSSKANPEATFNSIKEQITTIEPDLAKLLAGTKAGGRRMRKGAQEIKKLCQQLRKEVQEVVNELK